MARRDLLINLLQIAASLDGLPLLFPKKCTHFLGPLRLGLRIVRDGIFMPSLIHSVGSSTPNYDLYFSPSEKRQDKVWR